MTEVLAIFTAYLHEIWDILLEAAPYVLFGFFVAGMLKAFMPKDFVSRHLGRGNNKHSAAPVFKAAFFGIPLPLCSCGVIPAAAGLRKQGASKGAATSFLISTPETGVDSIAITYALLDPLMTVMRPFAAFLSAITAGLLVDNIPGVSEEKKPALSPGSSTGSGLQDPMEPLVIGKPLTATAGSPDNLENAQCSSGCCSGGAPAAPAPRAVSSCCSDAHAAGNLSRMDVKEKFKHGMHFAFGELVADIGKWLMLGIMLAAIITLFMPVDFIENYVGNGLFGMAMMVIVGIPMYVCATASTPIAAALALKGLSPGAALVFLLAGPATNVATITVVAQTLGKKVAVVYVSSIAVVAMILGLVVNSVYSQLGLSISEWISTSEVHTHGPVAYVSAIVLLGLVTYHYGKNLLAALQGHKPAHAG